MAEKRMFTQKIIDSDAFLDMPLSSQALYFHLNMRADDDGFVNNPKKVARVISASEDDLKLLLAKRFIIGFNSGVIVIKHWRMHNTLKSDRYHPTDYQDELGQLFIKPNKAYSDDPGCGGVPALLPPAETGRKQIGDGTEPEWNQSGTITEPERNQNGTSDIDIGLGLGLGLDKGSGKEENREDINLTVPNGTVCRTKDVRRVQEAWNQLGLSKVIKILPDTVRGNLLRKRIREYGVEDVVKAVEKVGKSSFLMGNNDKGWSATFDWFIKPNNFPKVLGGNYDDNAAEVDEGPTVDDYQRLLKMRDELKGINAEKGQMPAPDAGDEYERMKKMLEDIKGG